MLTCTNAGIVATVEGEHEKAWQRRDNIASFARQNKFGKDAKMRLGPGKV
jgi:hypothetical protein